MRSSYIGIIEGEGVGPEVMKAAIDCLDEFGHVKGKIELDYYDGPYDYSQETYDQLKDYYKKIQNRNGVILRASLHAPLVYKLRREFDLFYKLVHLKAIPELSDVAPLRKAVLGDTDLMLIRDNNRGPYHGVFKRDVQENDNEKASCYYEYDKAHIRKLANVAFANSMNRKRDVVLYIKESVLGSIGNLWKETFQEISLKYPKVKYRCLPPDSGAAELVLKPSSCDVIVALDTEADILSDVLASLISGSRGITPSVNFNGGGFGTYQTLHGTGRSLKGKDLANPISMINSVAMMLDLSLGLNSEAELIRKSIRDVIGKGYRTKDIFNINYANHRLATTEEMTKMIRKEIKHNKKNEYVLS